MAPLKEFWDSAERPLITVTEEDSLGTAMEKLVTRGIHRLFLVGADGRPCKVITITDLLAALHRNL